MIRAKFTCQQNILNHETQTAEVILCPVTTNPPSEDLSQSIRPLVDYIKTQIPCICDKHAEILAAQLIAGLPNLFREQPETFSRALCLTPQMKR